MWQGTFASQNSAWGLDTLSCQTAVHLAHHASPISYCTCRQESLMLTLKSHLDVSWKLHVLRLKSVNELFWPPVERAKCQNYSFSVPILLSQKINQYRHSYRIYMQYWRILLWQLLPEPSNNSMCISSLSFTSTFSLLLMFGWISRKQGESRKVWGERNCLSSFPH